MKFNQILKSLLCIVLKYGLDGKCTMLSATGESGFKYSFVCCKVLGRLTLLEACRVLIYTPDCC